MICLLLVADPYLFKLLEARHLRTVPEWEQSSWSRWPRMYSQK